MNSFSGQKPDEVKDQKTDLDILVETMMADVTSVKNFSCVSFNGF